MLKLKSLSLAIIAASVILSNQALASAPTPVLEQFTNSFFWDVHPEMRGKKIQPNQRQYQKEWL